MFKKASQKQEMIHEVTMKIQQRQKDVENWDLIKRFLSIYLAEVAIPHFKKKKNKKYIGAMQDFTLDEKSTLLQTRVTSPKGAETIGFLYFVEVL